MICKSVSPIPGKIRITFELPASLWAENISVVADFNDWDPSATPLRQDRDGVWRAVVDFQPNRLGSCNSVVSTRPLRRRPNPNLG